MANCKTSCGCNINANFGVAETTSFKAATRIGVMDYTNSDNEVNGFDLSDTWDQAFWTSQTANPDFTKRLHLTPQANESTPTVEDDVTQTLADGRIINIRDGLYTWEFHFYGTDATFYNAIKSRKCKENGIVFFDDCGSIAGHDCGEGNLNVVKILDGSLIVQYIPASIGTSASYTKVVFTIDQNENPVFDIVDNPEYNPNRVQPLYSGFAQEVTINTTTQTVASLRPVSAFTIKKDIPLRGLTTQANWTITDSSGATSNPTTVTESPDGTYDFGYAAIPVGVAEFYYLDDFVEVKFNTTIA